MGNESFKLLIVDDELLIRQGIINYIDWEKEGYQIIGEASNGREALQIIEQSKPHIIITDIVMPEMDGIELVKVVKEKYPDIEMIVLSSFEDFHYVKSTFQNGVADYILKPKLNTDELLHTLSRITEKKVDPKSLEKHSVSVEEMLKKQLQGYQSGTDLERLKQQVPFTQSNLLEIFWDEKQDISTAIGPLLEKYCKQIEKLTYYHIPFEENGKQLYLLNYQIDVLAQLKQKFNQLIAEIDPNAKAVLSQPFQTIEKMKVIYEENHQKLKQILFYFPEKSLLIYDKLPKMEQNKNEFDLNQFIYLFKHKHFDNAFTYLKEHVDSLSKQYDTDVFEFKSWLENIIFNITVLLNNMKYETDQLDAQKYQLFTEINEAFDVKDALSSFYGFLAKVEDLVLSSADQSPKMNQLLNYIEENYREHLTLSTLAAHFHFNPSYLSSYFSTHHKEGFSEYLNNVRIKKAMEMLETSTLSISTVSEMTGYSDPSYFCRVFKKMTGKSPSSYRKESYKAN
ncbi:two-component system, response regulator YesN [Gracilibacillus ureilyticus]|uniref:Two-component system, response regulator YesN n=1 Tax=Gracilibacillus ureilyticus TaxID=531814 RepID=A0A1H9R7I5_9BACI|nr:response regulator transcription factor [Gracilibacillus ureilyticus]SER68567.1 two-component system, response regulator YesN [Gracilibacillus ureilyticus]